jgi:hypothetical protein
MLPAYEVPRVFSIQIYGRKGAKKFLKLQELIICCSGHGNSKLINQMLSMPRGTKRDGRVLNKMQKVRELLRLHGATNNIIPETDHVTLIWITNSHSPILSVKPKDVLPPKGALFSCHMGNNISVVLLLNEVDPMNISLAIKLIQLF